MMKAFTWKHRSIQKVVKSKKNLEKKDTYSHTPLMYASCFGYPDIVGALIEAKADINAVGHDGCMPLHLAVQYSRLEVVKLLIKAGADLEAVASTRWTPLFMACRSGNLGIVKVLVHAGANLETVNPIGATPVVLASHFDNWDVVQFLLETGVDINPLFLHSENDFSKMHNFAKEYIEKSIQTLTFENLKKWKKYKIKALFI